MRKLRFPILLLLLPLLTVGIVLLASCSQKEPPAPEIPDLPASEGLEFDTFTDENGRQYAVVVGIGECNDTKLVIPHEYNGVTVEEIADKALYQSEGITEVIVPGTVKRIGKLAFTSSKELEKVTLCNGVTTIDQDAFTGCDKLSDVHLPSSIKYIGTFAFLRCNISEIKIPEGIEFIGQSCLGYTPYYYDTNNWEDGLLYLDDILIDSDHDKLKGVCTVRDGTRVIASAIFVGLYDVTSVIIPDTVEILGESVFSLCNGIKSVTLPDSVRIMGGGLFSGCFDLESVILPAGLTEIPAGTFERCSKLTSVSIPKGVTRIGREAFWDCDDLMELTLPEGLLEIEYRAFASCDYLTTLNIGSAIQKIGKDAFSEELLDIYYNGTCEQWEKVDIESSHNARIHFTE